MKNIWTEDMIRREFEALDRITGLTGASLPITMGDAYCTLGSFSVHGENMVFTFSKKYFHNINWSDRDAVQTIRHEYAHYMDYMIYGNWGHGATWKKCCEKIGTSSAKLYNSEFGKYNAMREKEENAMNSRIDKYSVGKTVKHPSYGTGVIEEIIGDGIGRVAKICFAYDCKKTIGIKWLEENT